MNKSLSPFENAGLPANLGAFANSLMQEGQSSAGAAFGDLLRFAARDGGSWVFGNESDNPIDGSQWAVNPQSFLHGYVCWKDKKPVGEMMVPVGGKAVNRNDLEDYGPDEKGKPTQWQEQYSLKVKCIGGEDEGVELEYKASTFGGIAAIKEVMLAVGQRINAGKTDVVPVVQLVNDSYIHKEYGKTYTPKLQIDSWLGMGGEPVVEEEEPQVDVLENEAPPPRRKQRAHKG